MMQTSQNGISKEINIQIIEATDRTEQPNDKIAKNYALKNRYKHTRKAATCSTYGNTYTFVKIFV
jgi:hypothetical protein